MLSYFVTLIAIIGIVLNIRKNRICFLAWMISNSYFCSLNFEQGNPAQAINFAVFLVFSIYGFFEWGRK